MTTNETSTFGKLHSHVRLDGLECRVLETLDGSFSLQYRREDNSWTEPMHSSKGAWSESLFIYAPALQESMLMRSPQESWSVASVGLGLGYLEILTAGLALQSGRKALETKITSFESRSQLRFSFLQFLESSAPSNTQISLDFVYDDIVRRVAQHVSAEPRILKEHLQSMWKMGSLCFKEDLAQELMASEGKQAEHSCLLFDAFSPDSSPDVWEENLLDGMMMNLCASNCIVVSYASRTVLKRVLKRNGFQLKKTEGFSGKRESTFARRVKP